MNAGEGCAARNPCTSRMRCARSIETPLPVAHPAPPTALVFALQRLTGINADPCWSLTCVIDSEQSEKTVLTKVKKSVTKGVSMPLSTRLGACFQASFCCCH